jgi:hypothetical protein
MSIREKTLLLFEDSCKNSDRALITICEAEKYLQQAYEGRYFFELIQNVRDANKEELQEGDIFIELNDNVLSIANTGTPFSEKGIASITTIGQSPKHSLDFIGFKGIGFKSTLEVSDTPHIITTEGSVYFDRKLTVKALNERNNCLKEDQVPLFFFPHYQTRSLTKNERERDIVTKIELPLKESFTEERICRDFSEIKVRQLVLLGNIRKVDFVSPTQRIIYNIQKDAQKNLLVVDDGDEILNRFRYYVPNEKTFIPGDILKSLEGKEKEIYSNSTSVDIHIVLELDKKNQFVPDEDAKLYLFYPLDIRSGFRFIIHSYFLVNPERTRLRNSPLNQYLLRKIGEYIGTGMLQSLKKGKYNTNEILCFERNKDAGIEELYDGLVETLETQKFIYDQHSHRYYKPSEVIIADGFDKGLFPDNRFDDRPVLYIRSTDIVKWLREEFDIYYLNYEEIASGIEQEAKKQVKRRNLSFFRNLYRYIDEHKDLNVSGKRILLTNNWKLISDNEDIFYGGRRNPVSLPASIQKYIHFMHNEIKLEVRETRIGVKEFNTNELIRKLLKLFNESAVPNVDVLNAIYHLAPQDVRSELDIKEKIQLPVKSQDEWISPFKHPVYFDTKELRELYPDGYFVDETVLNQKNTGGEEEETENHIQVFLKLCGTWDIPAFYICNDTQTVSHGNSNIREKHILCNTHLSDTSFYVENDRMLHKPTKYTKWFTDTIVENWELYKSLMSSVWLPKMKYSNNFSKKYDAQPSTIMKFSSFCEELSKGKWIVLHNGEQGYSPAYVVGGRLTDISKAHNKVIHKYLRLFPIDYESNLDFIESIGLCHLDGNTADNFNRLLKHTYSRYHKYIPEGKDFIDFYNRILSKIFDFYDRNEISDREVRTICNTRMLSVNETNGKSGWELSANIYYIDDKPNYDLLPETIRAKIQPHFTNRDRNTFGKIAAKVGKRFSTSITKRLVDAPILKRNSLTDFFSELPQTISLLEYNFDIAMSSHLEALKLVEVYRKEKIETEILIGELPSLTIESDYYVEKTTESFILHIKNNNLQQSKLIADCLTELFMSMLGRDLKRFNIDLWKFIKSINKAAYLADYDISPNRIDEIRQILYASDFTQKQKFWQAVYAIKKIPDFYKIVTNETVDIREIILSTGLDAETVRKINEEVIFDNISHSRNISLLSTLFHDLRISPSQINQYVYPEVNFRPYYQGLLEKEKNKFENKFTFILYQTMSKLSSSEQSAYQGWIHKYRSNFHPTVSDDIIRLDVKAYFIECLNDFYPSGDFTLVDFNIKVLFDLKSIYKKNLNTLISLLSNTDYSQEELTLFIEDEKRQSLLYFNHSKRLATEMKQWLVGQRENIPNKELRLLPEQVAMKYANQNKSTIEYITPCHVPEKTPSTSRKYWTGNGSNKYDGQKSNQQKQTIGMVAEMVVYEKLSEDQNLENVKWVSKYAARIEPVHSGYNPYGTDGLGYDIEYTDKKGNKYFIEVKGKADSVNCFEITIQEIEKAKLEKEFYHIILMTNTLNKELRRIKNLGNPFIFEEGEDILNNKRFSAVTKSYEIRFEE